MRRRSRIPYNAYAGRRADHAQETTATNAVNGLGAAANGYFGSAAQQSDLGAAAVNPSNLNAAAIGKYLSPYQSPVIGAAEPRRHKRRRSTRSLVVLRSRAAWHRSFGNLSTGLGNLGTGSGNLFALSDRRAKEDIRKVG